MDHKIITSINEALEKYTHFVSFCLCHCKGTVCIETFSPRKHKLECQKKYFSTIRGHHKGYFLKLASENNIVVENYLDFFISGFLTFANKNYNWESVYDDKSDSIELLFSCLTTGFEETTVSSSFYTHFIKYIYPALKALDKKDEIWLRHGPEKLDRRKVSYCKNDNYPLKYWSRHEDRNFWCVEVGKLPFKGCIAHQTNYVPFGIVSFSEFKKFGGVIDHMPNRDHYGAKAAIPLKDWMFLLNDEFEMGKKQWQLVEWSKGCIDYKVANQVFRTIEQIETIIKVCNG